MLKNINKVGQSHGGLIWMSKARMSVIERNSFSYSAISELKLIVVINEKLAGVLDNF